MKKKPNPLSVLQVAAEIYPLVKTGGLGDVMAALPPALARLGVDVRLLLPGLPAILDGVADLQPVLSFGPAFGAATIIVKRGRLAGSGVTAYVLDAPFLYERPGNPYLGSDGRDWHDNHRRFALLGWTAAHMAFGDIDRSWRPAIVHSHDWHAGLAPAYIASHPAPRPGSVYTIHNLAFQGLFPRNLLPELQLPLEFFAMEGLEFHGQISFMKAALHYCDRITTVSPTYAREIQHAEQGCGLEGVIARRAGVLHGILNGVDYAVWNPAADPNLASGYSTEDLAAKVQVKAALQAEMGLKATPEALLFGVVSRLTQQKGLDLLLAALPELIRRRGQLVLLGSGDAAMEQGYRALAAAHPEAVAVKLGYDEALSHRIIAGADLILVPSRFEPCGLTQLYGLRYGTLPLVRQVGGLADTVTDATAANLANDTATGFVFTEASAAGLLGAATRAFTAYANRPLWQQLMRRAMAQSFSWEEAARGYLDLYQAIGTPA
jgi:starch synthase